MEAELDTAVAVSPQSAVDLDELDAQAEQLWREVAAAQTRFAAVQAVAVVDEESKVRAGDAVRKGDFYATAASTVETEVNAAA